MAKEMPDEVSWAPFQVAVPPLRAEAPRSIQTLEGIGDRLRTAAFAEIQAIRAFSWAHSTFLDAPEGLRQAWATLIPEEEKHLGWLLERMKELGIDPYARRVSIQLFESLTRCKTAREFTLYMSSAEERGQRAGENFYRDLMAVDPISAKIFGKIAEEEASHVKLASDYLPLLPNPLDPRSVSSSSETS